MRQKAVIIDPRDNVATALAELRAGEVLELTVRQKTLIIELTAQIPFGHKFSLTTIESGSPVIKYGETIGIATTNIQPGDYVHTRNVVSARGRGDLAGGAK